MIWVCAWRAGWQVAARHARGPETSWLYHLRQHGAGDAGRLRRRGSILSLGTRSAVQSRHRVVVAERWRANTSDRGTCVSRPIGNPARPPWAAFARVWFVGYVRRDPQHARQMERAAMRALSYRFACWRSHGYHARSYLSNSAELSGSQCALWTRIRPAYAWPAAIPPAGFAVEQCTPMRFSAMSCKATTASGRRRLGDRFENRAPLLAGSTRSAVQSNQTRRHLSTHCQRGRAIAATLRSLHRPGNSAGVFSRPWAFHSMDSGARLIFNEIWDSGRARWAMIDVFAIFTCRREGQPFQPSNCTSY